MNRDQKPAAWGMNMSRGRNWPADSHPLHALSETLQSSANSLVLHAKENPHVSRLVSGYEIWESSLRQEARQRLATGLAPQANLHTFAPPGLPGLLGKDDWDLLRRVGGGSRALVPASGAGSSGGGPGGGSPRPGSPGSSGTGGMKRSASESSFTSSTFGTRRFNALSSNPFGTQEAPVTSRLAIRGKPMRPAAPSLQELGQALNPEMAARNLEAVATSIIESGKQVITHAHNSIQQTAANCQQNLSTLQSFLQNGLANTVGDGMVGPGLHVQRLLAGANSQSLQPFGPRSSSAPALDELLSAGGAVVPWTVFPRYLRAREQDAQDSSEEAAQQSMNQWYTPFKEYLDQLGEAQKQGAGSFKKAHASLRDPGRQVAIVTTASLPWMTGTAVNPLLRAAYLANDTGRRVTLVLPWLSPVDQERVFPGSVRFDSPEAQEQFVREWARQRTGLACNFKVAFYPGRYAAEKGSILPVGDVTSCIPDHEADVAVLEEPEHLNWYHHGRRWTDKFNHVVGVMHTNYLDYARREDGGQLKESLLKHINAWVCRIHCHKVIKLSDAVQDLPRQETMFVHGVSPNFIKVGERKALQAAEARSADPEHPEHRPPTWNKGAYFLGKVLWAKGYTELLDRLKEHTSRCGESVAVDVFGSGPDLEAVEEEAGRRSLDLHFNGAKDHADESLQDYKVFINPSLSDVVATTTAEALAMGKFVVCADHPSNRFFKEFPNCLTYRTSEEFSECLHRALSADPAPLSPADLHKLTWEAATERFLEVAELDTDPPLLETAFDNVLAATHNALTGMEALRVFAGAGPQTRDAPARITDYQPSEYVGGCLDNHNRAKKQQKKKKEEQHRKQQQHVQQMQQIAEAADVPPEESAAASTSAVPAVAEGADETVLQDKH